MDRPHHHPVLLLRMRREQLGRQQLDRRMRMRKLRMRKLRVRKLRMRMRQRVRLQLQLQLQLQRLLLLSAPAKRDLASRFLPFPRLRRAPAAAQLLAASPPYRCGVPLAGRRPRREKGSRGAAGRIAAR